MVKERGDDAGPEAPRVYMTPFSAWSSVGAVPSRRGWSEQALLTLLAGEHACPLQTRWTALFEALTRLGPQQVVATNAVGALGVLAPLEPLSGDDARIRLGGPSVHLALDPSQLGAALATGAPRAGVLPPAVRLFDHQGDALLTFAPGPDQPADALPALARRHRRAAPAPLPTAPVAPRVRPTPTRATLDAALDAWLDPADPRDLAAILSAHDLSRSELFCVAPDRDATPLPAHQLVEVLRWMVSRGRPMTVQVDRTGVSARARLVPSAIEVGPGGVELAGGAAVLRLVADQLHHGWLVTERSAQGVQRSLELLDASGELAVRLGGPTASRVGAGGWVHPPHTAHPSGPSTG